ncbi:hypothetical protein AB07_2417 [Citrobacter freundii]|nr:hypothetical protein AB07_2417 [Citrobacter freundii]
MKSEQSTLHLCDFFSLWIRPVRPMWWGDKKFFQVLLFTLFTSGFLLIISW